MIRKPSAKDYWNTILPAAFGVTTAFRAWDAYSHPGPTWLLGIPSFVLQSALAVVLIVLAFYNLLFRPPYDDASLAKPRSIVQKIWSTFVLIALSTIATAWAIHSWRNDASRAGVPVWLLSTGLALAAWYVTLRLSLRDFCPTLAERLRAKRPTRWRVVGDFRLPLSPMYWIDAAALACGLVLAALGTRFWAVATLLVLVGVLRLGERFDVFSDREV